MGDREPHHATAASGEVYFDGKMKETLEDVQHLGGHADPRTTRIYDRRQKK